MDKTEIERALSGGFPPADEDARENLLNQCLEVLCQDNVELNDDELDMVVAAGDSGMTFGHRRIGQDSSWNNS